MNQNKTYQFSAAKLHSPKLNSQVIKLMATHSTDPSKSLSAEIAPEYGSNLIKLTFGNNQIISADTNKLKAGLWTGTPILWPYPNRARNFEGKKAIDFNDTTISLETRIRKQGNPPLVHGLVDDQAWELINFEEDNNLATVSTRITIAKNSPLYQWYPFFSQLSLKFILKSDRIRIEHSDANLGKEEKPASLAYHPYFNRLSKDDGTLVTIQSSKYWETDQELLPTGKLITVNKTNHNLTNPVPVGQLDLDHVYLRSKPSDLAIIDYTKQKFKVILKSSPEFDNWVIYTGNTDPSTLCLENQIGPTNVFNLYKQAIKEKNMQLSDIIKLPVVPTHQTKTGFVEYIIQSYR